MNQNNGQVHPVFQDIFASFGMAQQNARRIVKEVEAEFGTRPPQGFESEQMHLVRNIKEGIIKVSDSSFQEAVKNSRFRTLEDVEVHRFLPTIESNQEVNRIKQIVDTGKRFIAIMQANEQGTITVFEAETLFEQLDSKGIAP